MYRNSCVVFYLVVVYCVFFVNGASSQRTNEVRNQPNCSLVRSFFEMRNISITLDEDDHPGKYSFYYYDICEVISIFAGCILRNFKICRLWFIGFALVKLIIVNSFVSYFKFYELVSLT